MSDLAPADLRDLASPCGLSDEERELLRVWAAAGSGDIAAYVNQRRSDDPAITGQVVVTKQKKRLYLVHRPVNTKLWIVTSAVERSEVGRFPTLRTALDVIRPMLRAVEATAKSTL